MTSHPIGESETTARAPGMAQFEPLICAVDFPCLGPPHTAAEPS
jgi:hypothetical protein